MVGETGAGRKKTVADIDVTGKRVFVRADFNVPLDASRHITDDTRIRATLPTIRLLLERQAAVILASHLGRPDGKVVDTLSLSPIRERLEALLGQEILLAPDCVGDAVEKLALDLLPGHVLLLENVRFHSEEEENDAAFASRLAKLADLYVNDAFGAAHRAHASTEGIAHYLPSVAGLLMAAELSALGSVLSHPDPPLAAIIGGAKISTKMGVLRHLLGIADDFLIGGGMANTFLKAQGKEIGASLVEDDQLQAARDFLESAGVRGRRVCVPVDAVVAEEVREGASTDIVSVDRVPAGWSIVDIGPETVNQFAEILNSAKTIVWNGPMGVFEIPGFSLGTKGVAVAVAHSSARSIVGGGDSVAAVEQLGLAGQMSHISTGGGASLEFLEGRELPGVKVLPNQPI